MKKIVTLIAMLLSLAVSTQAQTSLVATLSHEGTVTTFYSANGLKDAYAAAVDGDIITLSAGQFTAVDIAKGITIRGAGMDIENNPTIINGNVELQDNPEGSGEHHLTLEGVYVHGRIKVVTDKTITNPSFIKTRVTKIGFNNNSTVTNIVFADCILDEINISHYDSKPRTASFINSIIKKVSSLDPTGASFTNCVIGIDNYSFSTTFNNCIFSCEINYYLDSSCTATYCYYLGSNITFFNRIPFSATNHIVDADTVIFKEGSFYELSDDLATTWLGSDGTQVGIYGGSLPFDPVPSNPRITKFNVAPKTTADGKLSVEIEVKSN